jgi:hypothetical protein
MRRDCSPHTPLKRNAKQLLRLNRKFHRQLLEGRMMVQPEAMGRRFDGAD